MALAGTRKISLSEIEQKINVNRRIGKKASIDELEAFAQEAIERIRSRTLDGEDINGRSFAQYSESYAKQKGVSRNSVDLFLEGDMLESLDYEIDEDKGTVTIKVLGDLQVKKGYNHHVGDRLPKRSWFGLTPREADEIASTVESTTEQSGVTLADIQSAISAIGLDILDE
jgi:hypothetical protein